MCKARRSSRSVGRPAQKCWTKLPELRKGEVIADQNVDEIVKGVAKLTDPPPLIRRVPLWSHPILLGVFVSLLGVFWVARKAVGLI